MRVSVGLGLALLFLAAAITVSSARDDFEDEDDFATVETDDEENDETVVNVETVRENEVVYLTPQTPKEAYFSEHFDDPDVVMDKKFIRKARNSILTLEFWDSCGTYST